MRTKGLSLLTCGASILVQQSNQLLQLFLLCVGVDSCGDNHLKQFAIVSHSRVNLLPELGVEAEEGDFLDLTIGPTLICQGL